MCVFTVLLIYGQYSVVQFSVLQRGIFDTRSVWTRFVWTKFVSQKINDIIFFFKRWRYSKLEVFYGLSSITRMSRQQPSFAIAMSLRATVIGIRLISNLKCLGERKTIKGESLSISRKYKNLFQKFVLKNVPRKMSFHRLSNKNI